MRDKVILGWLVFHFISCIVALSVYIVVQVKDIPDTIEVCNKYVRNGVPTDQPKTIY